MHTCAFSSVRILKSLFNEKKGIDMFKSFKDHRLFMGFMLSYIFVLLVPLTMGALSYAAIIGTVEGDIIDSNISMLEQTRDMMDKWLHEVEMTSQQLSFNKNVRHLLSVNEEEDPTYHYQLKKLLDELVPYKIKSDVMDSFYIYFRNNDTIVTPDTVYRTPLFYDVFLKNNRFSYEDWIELLSTYSKGHYVPNFDADVLHKETAPKIAYISTLPLQYEKTSKGAVMILIDEYQIQQLLEKLNIGEDGWYYIMDENGTLITSSSSNLEEIQFVHGSLADSKGHQQIKVDQREMVVAYATSSYNGWQYVAVTPSNIVMQKAIKIKNSIKIFIAISLLIGGFIAISMAERYTKPLKNMVSMLKDFVDGEWPEKNTYEYIESTIEQLAKKNETFQQTMEAQLPLLYVSFFDRLFRGDFNSNQETMTYANYIHMDLEGKQYVVLILRMYEHQHFVDETIVKELGMSKVVIKDVIGSYIAQDGYIHDVDENEIAILKVTQKENEGEFKQEIQDLVVAIYNDLLKQYNMQVFFAIGNIYKDVQHISRSYQEAMEVLDNKVIKKQSKGIWYQDIPKQQAVYYYPIDVRQRLLNLGKTGDTEELIEFLNTILDENFVRRNLSLAMYEQFIYELRGTLIQLRLHVNEEDEIKHILDRIAAPRSLDEIRSVLVEEFEAVSQKVNDQKRSHNIELKEKIIAYIHESYQEPNLSRYDVASQFGLAEGYLSHFFKEQAGENFSNYLEGVRIKEASRLLEETDLTIQEIADQVGYNSVQSFRRAFKRVTGLTPSNLRI